MGEGKVGCWSNISLTKIGTLGLSQECRFPVELQCFREFQLINWSTDGCIGWENSIYIL